MSELKMQVKIDGTTYTQQQLDMYAYQRDLHVLHELKRLGVKIEDQDHELSHTDINWLDPKRAAALSLDIRASFGEQKVLQLFKDVEADAERRWKEFNVDYDPAEIHSAVTEIEISGVDMKSTLAVLGGASDERQALSVNPEHYIVIGDITSGQRGMETFGMFGEPIYVYGTSSQNLPAGSPLKKDPAYPIAIYGEMKLKSDDTPVHVGAFHQLRPTDNGFASKSTFVCPKKAPKAIADGHKIHFALEITNSAKVAFQNLHGPSAEKD